MNLIIKYRRKYAYAALFSYLFLVSLTIFHYHHVDMVEGNYSVESSSGTEQSPFDKLIDVTHECTVQQFAGTVINLNYSEELNIINVVNEEKFLFNEKEIHYYAPRYNGNPHRAPPPVV